MDTTAAWDQANAKLTAQQASKPDPWKGATFWISLGMLAYGIANGKKAYTIIGAGGLAYAVITGSL